jgi:transcriptional regulator with XRE-family HTH domain
MENNATGFNFANNLRQIRLHNKQTQGELASALSVSQDTVSLWERNKSYPDLKTFFIICKTYSVSADYLIGLDE